jgi:predicted glycosyltransferase
MLLSEHPSSSAAPRFFLYSHDGMGLGHTRRHIAIARALSELDPSASVLLVTGTEEVTRLGIPAQVEILKLPGLRKVENGSYVSRRMSISAEEIRTFRASLLRTAVRSFKPNVVLVDKHPFGASGEFREALRIAKDQGARSVLGLRDILDSPETVAAEWTPYRTQRAIAKNYDQVFVYGHAHVFDSVREYRFPDALASRTRFCGYVVNPAATPSGRGGEKRVVPLATTQQPLVIASAGGGEDGAFLIESFVRSAVDVPWKGMAVAGPMMPESRFRLLERIALRNRVIFRRFVPDLPNYLQIASAVVCMGGYNTLGEALAAGVPTVCVPRVEPREEQLIRAQAFGRLGLMTWLHPRELTPDRLGAAISLAVNQSRQSIRSRVSRVLNFQGAQAAALQLHAQARESLNPGRLPLCSNP